MHTVDPNRNPIIIPKDEKKSSSGCPQCHGMNYGGRKIQGALLFTCRDCKNQWAGGLPQERVDPRLPRPPENPTPPPVYFTKLPNRNETVEVRRPVQLTQSFRRGAPFPEPGEEDV